MNKKMKWIAAGIAVGLLVVLAAAWGMKGSPVAGQKHIILHIKGIENQKDVEVDTDCETLAEALNEQKDLQVKIDEGPYGAYLVSLIGETAAKDQGWVYESPNNEVCLSMEYCPALEQVMIQDQDEFIFSLIGGFE